MKTLYKALPLLCFIFAQAKAQEDQEFGTLNILSLVSSPTSCEVTLGGKTVMPEGLSSGNSSGWFFIPAGDHQMNIEHPDFKKASGSISVAKDSTEVIVIFLQPTTRKKPDGTPMPPNLRIRRYPAFETSKGFALKAASMQETPERYQIGETSFNFEKSTAIDIPKWNGGGFSISHSGKVVATVPNREDKGSYYLFFAKNPDGKHLAGFVLSNPIVVPEP